MIYPEITLAQMTVSLFEAYGIKNIVISPGSRNAPLTVGFTNNSFFNCYSIVDERCAAFVALGISQQSKKPTAVVCTSGSALLNYFPGVAEAFYSNIPLIVLSADRPKYLVGIGDGQTINQVGVYGDHILYDTNLKSELNNPESLNHQDAPPLIKNIENKLEKFLGLVETIETHNEQEIRKAIEIAYKRSGPVHINIPFDEPLYGISESSKFNFSATIPSPESDDSIDFSDINSSWNNYSKILILVGALDPDSIEQTLLDKLVGDQRVLVFTETLSNIHHANLFPSIDNLITFLSDEEFKELQPDLLLTFGGMVVSKRIKAFLRKYRPKEHWHVGLYNANDTFFSLNKHIRTTPNKFLEKVQTIEHSSNYQNHWISVRDYKHQQHKKFLSESPFSDLKVFEAVLKALPKNSILHLSNSATVRYSQLFTFPPEIQVFCNRGTSGIDGSTSTAIGASIQSAKQNIFISGDLSFFYDSNALWNNYIPNNFRIIVINNEGGGIFRILPGPKKTKSFEKFFETHHQLSAKQLCEMYSIGYAAADNLQDVQKCLSEFFEDSEKPQLLEIFTPRLMNDQVLLDYFQFLR